MCFLGLSQEIQTCFNWLMDSGINDYKKVVELQRSGCRWKKQTYPGSASCFLLPGHWEGNSIALHTLSPGPFYLAVALKVTIPPDYGLELTQREYVLSSCFSRVFVTAVTSLCCGAPLAQGAQAEPLLSLWISVPQVLFRCLVMLGSSGH